MKNEVKKILGEGLLYLTNHVVNHLPFHWLRLNFYRNFLKLEIAPGSHIFLNAWFDSKKKL